ncbi:hypothetical protein AK812_SmicGene23827 [Symbiodinium microadriaticum]|uniref:Uncharacterized protein n=1 Tax=Symbiodinium microadriaticum TaxID=2951 RepID=A0A1Q9DG47_SYMMI|nr:hypothetical protein AK812_SmicGene23827 [Symbiodinium microadriaticum]CAE7413592.1 unnamed protein product [Symbiodinium microadriaticum]
MAALHEPSPHDTTAEGDSAQPASTTTAEPTVDTDEWWRSSASWWNHSDWRWSGWWGNRWDNQQWPWAPRHSYATVQTEGDQSGAQPSSPPRDGSGDRHGQQHWRSSGSGFENAANEAASSPTGPSSAMAGESQCPFRLRRTPWIRGSHGEHNGVVELVSVSLWPGRLQLQGSSKVTTASHRRGLDGVTADSGHRTLGWELQTEFEHLTEVMEMKAGVQRDAEKRVAFRSVLTDTSRRLRDFTRAGSFGLELPAELRSSLLREGAGLSEQNQQNLTTLLRGRELDVDYLALLLSRMDARTERITGFVTHEEEANSPEIFLAEPGQGEEEPSEDESEADFEDSDVIALEELNFTEDQANYVYAGVGGGLPGARDQRPRGSKGQGRGKLTRDQMKKISSQLRQWSGLGAHGGPKEVSFLDGASTEERPAEPRHHENWNFLTFKSGDAILDIGATQDIIGLPAMEALDKTLQAAGLRSIEVPTVANAPTGIGGQAKVVRSVLVPVSPGGAPGVINFLVIQSNVPPLLSVGLLEHLGASFDLVTNQICFEKIGVRLRMGVQASGHRTIPLVQWSGGHFPVPEEVQQQYSLTDDAFDRDSKALRTHSTFALLWTDMHVLTILYCKPSHLKTPTS